MPARRIIPCLDVKSGRVVKGVRFRNHRDLGDPLELALLYCQSGADELVFYDIAASPAGASVDASWIRRISDLIDIPFSVAGGITSVDRAVQILDAGADKISINTPALRNPELIDQLAARCGSQCVVIGIDTQMGPTGYEIYQCTGDTATIHKAQRSTLDWVREVQRRGAGEIVLNCMNADGVRTGFDIEQCNDVRAVCDVPLIASGGAGCADDFVDVFNQADVDGALAASIFHLGTLTPNQVKATVAEQGIEVRL
ncbi:MAG: imidazole glycerol phosphate synthase subunit HisF [Lysobacteraceae bacterium]|nr:MAG: imidazole glycerol phosphate synthase subunit HisF [Xanthomonadaceae bacterium]